WRYLSDRVLGLEAAVHELKSARAAPSSAPDMAKPVRPAEPITPTQPIAEPIGPLLRSLSLLNRQAAYLPQKWKLRKPGSKRLCRPRRGCPRRLLHRLYQLLNQAQPFTRSRHLRLWIASGLPWTSRKPWARTG